MSETYTNGTLTAFFDTREDAQEAASRLRDIGIPDGAIRIVGDETRSSATTTAESSDAGKGFWESLGDFFFPDEDRAVYAEGLRRGGTLLTVSNIPEGLYNQTLDILDDEGTVDIDTRSESWRSEGWTGSDFTAGSSTVGDTTAISSSKTYGAAPDAKLGTGLSSPAGTTTRTASAYGSSDRALDAGLRSEGDDETIKVMEEQLRVGKRDVNLGRVRVRSYVVEEPVNESVNLRSERVTLERRPVDRALTGTEAAFTDRTIEATEHAEEAVVSKEARVKEEIGLRREADERTETVSDTVRRTEVEIDDERLEADRVEGERLGGAKPVTR